MIAVFFESDDEPSGAPAPKAAGPPKPASEIAQASGGRIFRSSSFKTSPSFGVTGGVAPPALPPPPPVVKVAVEEKSAEPVEEAEEAEEEESDDGDDGDVDTDEVEKPSPTPIADADSGKAPVDAAQSLMI